MLKVVRVLAELHTDIEFLHALAEAGLIRLEPDSGGEVLISEDDAERVRLVQLLTSDLDVNLPGVEVILHMRETMVAMQRQVQEILEAVVAEMRARGGH
jgi:MerR family transcriptional regulator/heat shock protein HspR